jgi:hypothetical protein
MIKNIVKRIVGGVIIFTVSYLLLNFWNIWGLSRNSVFIISICLGVIFVLLGGSILEWIEEIHFWS